MSCQCNRRNAVVMLAAAALVPGRARADVPPEATRFLAEARRMRAEAVSAGDQPYGAVLVVEGRIEGWGRSRVVSERNPDAHAERVAIRDAQQRLGRQDLSGSILYSTSRPCGACEAAAAQAQVARMIHGEGTDAGPPRGRTG